MRKGITAAALGVGLTLTACTSAYSPEAPPAPFAGSLTESADTCPTGTGKFMGLVPLDGELAKPGRAQDIARESDRQHQKSVCKTALLIGNVLLEAVNHPNPDSGFTVEVYPRGDGYKAIGASKKGEEKSDHFIEALYALTDPDDPTKPARLTGVTGVWEPDWNDRKFQTVRLTKVGLIEGGSGWDMQSTVHDGDKKTPIFDPAEPVSNIEELDIRMNKAATALRVLTRIPAPIPPSETSPTSPPPSK